MLYRIRQRSSETKTEKKQDDKKQQNKTQSSESQKKDKPKAKPQLTQESHSDNSPNIGTITQGPGSIAQVGGQGNQATVNNFGAPDPTLSWTQEQKQYGSNPPEVLVTLSVDHLLEVPAFAALCDRPCESGLHGDVSIDGMHSEKWLTIDGNPNAVGIELKFPRPLGPGVEVRWRIRSRDQEPIRVKDVQKIPLFALPK